MRIKIYLVLFIIYLGSSETLFAQSGVAAHPVWSAQSNIYEVNLRQFSKSGSIKDFEKHLERLKKRTKEK